jgi:hypothetical protein
MDTCSRVSRSHISKEREKMDKSLRRVEPTSPRMENQNLKKLKERYIVQELG